MNEVNSVLGNPHWFLTSQKILKVLRIDSCCLKDIHISEKSTEGASALP